MPESIHSFFEEIPAEQAHIPKPKLTGWVFVTLEITIYTSLLILNYPAFVAVIYFGIFLYRYSLWPTPSQPTQK